MDRQNQVSTMLLHCLICKEEGRDEDEAQFESHHQLISHIKDFHGLKFEGQKRGKQHRSTCDYCTRTYRNPINHFVKFHSKTMHKCRRCHRSFLKKRQVIDHNRDTHGMPVGSEFEEIETAFGRRVVTFQKNYRPNMVKDYESLFVELKHELFSLIRHQQRINSNIRVSLIVMSQYKRLDEFGEVVETSLLTLRLLFKNVYMAHGPRQIKRLISDMRSEIIDRDEAIVNSGSGWILDYVSAVNLEVAVLYELNSAGCDSRKNLLKDIPKKKKACLRNVSGEDDKCFFNAVSLGMCGPKAWNLPKSKRDLLVKQHSKLMFDIKGFSTPLHIMKVPKFERRHQALDLAVNIFTYDVEAEETRVVLRSIYQNANEKKRTQVNLLLMKNHYLLITDLNEFIREEGERKGFYCEKCLSGFTTEDAVQRHKVLCMERGGQTFTYPSPGEEVRFGSYEKTVMEPIFGVVDFEACMKPKTRLESAIQHNCLACANNEDEINCTHATRDIHEQVPTTYSMVFADEYGDIIFSETESDDENVMTKFFESLFLIQKHVHKKLQKYRYKTDYTDDENRQFDEAEKCYMCNQKFSDENEDKVRDHCHYSNKYLGAAHNQCNLKRFVRKKIKVFVHNLKNYDSHFIIKALSMTGKKKIGGICENMEKFKTLEIDCLRFVDSSQLIPGSLSSLVDHLSKSSHNFSLLDKFPFCTTQERKELLLRKGVYPYEWAESIEQLKEAKDLPERRFFYSSLSEQDISEEDYAHAKKVFSVFGCKNMLEYCELYCLLDTILTAEVLVHFRKVVYTTYKLDALQYISAPQLSHDAWLKTKKHKVEMMHDPTMIWLIINAIRGGLCFINTRHKKVPEDSDNEHILYTDVNNLYSVAQSEYLPAGKFKWCTTTVLEQLEEHLLSIPPDCDVGYILCVDMSYPSNLHDSHSSFPLAPSKQEFTFDDLSPYSQNSLIHLRGEATAKRYKSSKLCSSFLPKIQYVTHYRNVQTYLRLGMKLDKIWYAFKFRQAPIMREFIQTNTLLRQKSKTKAVGDVYKLFNNTNYGKCIQDVLKFLLVIIITSNTSLTKKIRSPFYKGHRILDDNLVLSFESKAKARMAKLYSVGFSILEASKLHMAKLWYDVIEPAIIVDPDQYSIPNPITELELILTDTDSLMFYVKGMTREELFKRLYAIMDFSNYPIDHPLYSKEVKAVPGFLKDENAGEKITEVVGLRSKCYMYKVATGNTSIVCKGIGKSARNNLSLEQYKSCIEDFNQIKSIMSVIRSKNHVLHTQKIRKLALSSTDDKRYLKYCGIHSIPHGHYDNKFYCTKCLDSLKNK